MLKMNLEDIAKADDFLLAEMMFAISDRYKLLHPDFELVIFPLPDPIPKEYVGTPLRGVRQ